MIKPRRKQKMKTRKKGSEQPIWILVAILLALIVGVMMYQFLQKGQQTSTFNNMLETINIGTAQFSIDNLCSNWRSSNWQTPPSTLGTVSVDYAAKVGILDEDEWATGAMMTVCDCAVYLYVDRSMIQRSEVFTVADPATCHTLTAAKYPSVTSPVGAP